MSFLLPVRSMSSPAQTSQKPSAFKKRVRKILRSPKLLLLSSILLVLTATLLFANKGIWRHIALRSEISGLHEIEAKLTADEKMVQKQVDKLKAEEPNTIERIARERYHMKKSGEIIYRVENK